MPWRLSGGMAQGARAAANALGGARHRVLAQRLSGAQPAKKK